MCEHPKPIIFFFSITFFFKQNLLRILTGSNKLYMLVYFSWSSWSCDVSCSSSSLCPWELLGYHWLSRSNVFAHFCCEKCSLKFPEVCFVACLILILATFDPPALSSYCLHMQSLCIVSPISALNEKGVSRAPVNVWDLVPGWLGNGQER